jgi:acyl-coenzyme A thioesterase PaaI-like protein
MNKHSKRLLPMLLRESTDWSYGKYTVSTIQSVNYDHSPEKLIYKYKPPPAFCHEIVSKENKNVKELYFSTSGILAAMDEMSTYAICFEDHYYRGGVSVDLFVESVKPVPANEDVYVVTRTDKIGKILAFCTMELTSLEGEILARGKHIKYLPLPQPLGAFLDGLAVSPIFPMLLTIYYKLVGKRIKTPLDHVFKIFKNEVVPVSRDVMKPEHAFHILNLTANEDPEDRKALLVDAPDNHHCETSEIYNMKVKRELCNFLGAMHGGAVATACEESSRLFKEKTHPELQHLLKLRSLDLRFLSPVKVKNESNCLFHRIINRLFLFFLLSRVILLLK